HHMVYPLFLLLSSLSGRPLASTLFPYTTLFRSCRDPPALRGRPGQRRQGTCARGRAHHWPHAIQRPHARRRHLSVLRDEREDARSEEHTSELQSRENLVCRLLPEKKHPPSSTAH